MPFRPKRPCSVPGCPELVDSGYCPKHTREKRVRQDSTLARREHHAFYASKAWLAVRRIVLQRDPVCKNCGDRLSSIGAHKVPRRLLRALRDTLPSERFQHARLLILAREYGLEAWQDGHNAWFRRRDGKILFEASWQLLCQGHDYALDEDAVEGWCKPCHDRDSGREAHRGLLRRGA